MSRDEATFQMLWSCEYCETQKLLALDHKHCPVCGGAQNPKTRYYPEPGDEVAVADHVYAGADKNCPACDTPSAAVSTFCGTCGSDLAGAKDSQTRDEQRVKDGEAFQSDSATVAKNEHKERKVAEERARIDEMSGKEAATPKSEGSGKSVVGIVVGLMGMFGVFALGIVLCLGIGWLLQKEVSVVAVGHSWERVVEVEEYKSLTESAWKESLPRGARQVRCVKKIQSHRDVQDGETCETLRTDQGDGTFKKSQQCKPTYKKEPVYGEKCSFEVDRWQRVRRETASGTNTSDRAWPLTKLVREGNCLGCQREGARSEVLTARFTETETDVDYSAVCHTEVEWLAVVMGQQYEATGSVGSTKLECASLIKID